MSKTRAHPISSVAGTTSIPEVHAMMDELSFGERVEVVKQLEAKQMAGQRFDPLVTAVIKSYVQSPDDYAKARRHEGGVKRCPTCGHIPTKGGEA